MQKSNELLRLIKYRPEQLSDLTDSALRDELERELIPVLRARKKSRKKIITQEKRTRRTKAAKNRYEHRVT
jgi:hypothetical protein